MFIGLHRHSHYSKRDAIAKVPDIVNRIGELGQKAWALTDHGTTSGLMEAFKVTEKYNKEHGTDIKFIFGVEAYWIPNYYIKDRKQSCHLLLLAKNEVGYKNLLRLVTIGYGDKGNAPDNYFYTMRLTTEDIEKYKEGLLVSSACMGGILNPEYEDMSWNKSLAYDRAREFQRVFGDSFFLEVQCATDDRQIDYNKRIIQMGKELNIPVFVSEDSHYVYKEQADTHRKWLGIDIEPDNPDAYYQTDDYYIHSEDEVRAALDYLPSDVVDELIANTEKIADSIERVKIKFGEKHFPTLDLHGKTPLEVVKEKCREHWKEKMAGIPKEKWPIYVKQLEHEFKILEKCDYLNYFIMTEDFIRSCRDRGIRMGIGRGSVGGCLVAYLMDITRIDPIKYGLIFERFAHDKRSSLPDVDIDVPNTRRKEAIQILVDKYGEVYHVRSFGMMGSKAAITRAADALGYKPAETKKIKSACGGEIENIADEKLKELSKAYVGVLQNNTVHASAVMLFPSDPTEWCAIEKQGDDYVTAYEYHDLEAQGLLKEDVLGIKTLDAIDNCIKMTGENIDIDHLPDDDKLTFDMLNAEDVKGCFQIESGGMVNIIKQITPQNVFDLVPLVALYRPSTIQSGMVDEFCDRRKGAKFQYLHEWLKDSLSETYGVMLYQEQAMKIVQAMAGYDLGQADMFRRAIGRKIPSEMAELIPRFVKDGEAKGVDSKTMKKLAEWLTNAAAYQFNKSHSAAYGVTCYQTAYLKAHYPAEYLCAYLNAYTGDKQEDLLPYIQDIKKHGIELLPPDASKDTCKWHIEGKDGKKAIRMGVNFIRGVGEIGLPLDKERFKTLNRSKTENLIKAGAMDFMGDRQAMLVSLYNSGEAEKLNKKLVTAEERIEKNKAIYETAKEGTKKKAEAYAKMLKYSDDKWEIVAKLKEVANANTDFDRIKCEMEVLGMTFENPFEGYDLSKFQEPDKDDTCSRLVLGIVRRIKHWKQKNGKPMMFFTIECPSGKTYDIVMFNYVYQELELNKVYRFRIAEDKFKKIV